MNGLNEDDLGENKDIFWEKLTIATESGEGKAFIADEFNGRVGSGEINNADTNSQELILLEENCSY